MHAGPLCVGIPVENENEDNDVIGRALCPMKGFAARVPNNVTHVAERRRDLTMDRWTRFWQGRPGQSGSKVVQVWRKGERPLLDETPARRPEPLRRACKPRTACPSANEPASVSDDQNALVLCRSNRPRIRVVDALARSRQRKRYSRAGSCVLNRPGFPTPAVLCLAAKAAGRNGR